MAPKINTYVALLRGVNVGGKNIIPMAELRSCFDDIGMTDVSTYIQSGNVLFKSGISTNKKIVSTLEKALSESFAYDARVVVVKKEDYLHMVGSAHKSWGKKDDQKHNAMFLVDQTDASDFLSTLPDPKRGIDSVSTCGNTIFWSAKKEMITRSSMMQIAKLKAYKRMTVRNHKTTWKLVDMLEAM